MCIMSGLLSCACVSGMMPRNSAVRMTRNLVAAEVIVYSFCQGKNKNFKFAMQFKKMVK